MPRDTACLRRIAFVDPVEEDAPPSGFLMQIPHELAVGPLTNLLIGGSAQTHPSLDVTHIPHGDAGDTLLRTEVHRLLRRLVQDVALLAIQFGAYLGFALQETLAPPRAGLAVAQLLLQDGVLAVAALFAGAQHSPRDNEGMPSGRGHGGDMYFPPSRSPPLPPLGRRQTLWQGTAGVPLPYQWSNTTRSDPRARSVRPAAGSRGDTRQATAGPGVGVVLLWASVPPTVGHRARPESLGLSTRRSDSASPGGDTRSAGAPSRLVLAGAARLRWPRWRRTSGTAPVCSGCARHTARLWSLFPSRLR